jgi:hypothetical protein
VLCLFSCSGDSIICWGKLGSSRSSSNEDALICTAQRLLRKSLRPEVNSTNHHFSCLEPDDRQQLFRQDTWHHVNDTLRMRDQYSPKFLFFEVTAMLAQFCERSVSECTVRSSSRFRQRAPRRPQQPRLFVAKVQHEAAQVSASLSISLDNRFQPGI